MEIRLDIEKRLIELDFESSDEIDTFRVSSDKRRRVLLRLPADVTLKVDTQVAQVFRSGSNLFGTLLDMKTSFELSRPDLGLDTEIESAECLTPESVSDIPSNGEMTGESPVFRIQKMNVSEKIHLASRASRSERQILQRDSSPQVLMALLANPHMEDKDLLEIVKSHHAASGVLQRIAKDPRWTANYEVRLALVKNPKTPTVLAQKLLPSLNRKDLGTLAKGTTVREAIKGAALRLYLRQM